MARDKMSIADLKLISRSMKEMRYAAKIVANYQAFRKVGIFGSARIAQDSPEAKVAEEFARQMVVHNFMIITGGGDGIMGAAQRGAGRDMSFGLNIRLPFEQRANETIEGDKKLINFNYFFTRKLNFVKETHAAALFPGGAIVQSKALPQERNEPEILSLPRLVLTPHRRSFGRFRQLIDALNRAECV